MRCPYRHDHLDFADKCNRGCTGFECKHRAENIRPVRIIRDEHDCRTWAL